MEYHQTQTPRQQGQAWQGNQQSAQQFQDHQNHQSRMAEITSEPPHVPGLDLNGSNNQNNLNLSGGQQNIDQLNGNQDSGQIRYAKLIIIMYFILSARHRHFTLVDVIILV